MTIRQEDSIIIIGSKVWINKTPMISMNIFTFDDHSLSLMIVITISIIIKRGITTWGGSIKAWFGAWYTSRFKSEKRGKSTFFSDVKSEWSCRLGIDKKNETIKLICWDVSGENITSQNLLFNEKSSHASKTKTFHNDLPYWLSNECIIITIFMSQSSLKHINKQEWSHFIIAVSVQFTS